MTHFIDSTLTCAVFIIASSSLLVPAQQSDILLFYRCTMVAVSSYNYRKLSLYTTMIRSIVFVSINTYNFEMTEL